MPISDALVAAEAARLHALGIRYNSRQLYYAVCAAVEASATPSAARASVGWAILFGLLAAIGGRTLLRPIGAAIACGFLLLVGYYRWRHRHRGHLGRFLAISYADFKLRFVGPSLPGLLTADAKPGVAGDLSFCVGRCRLVCDQAETAAFLAANLAGVTAIPDAGTLVDRASDPPLIVDREKVYCLHDASPSGCELPFRLRDEGRWVVDLGLQPAAAMTSGLPVIEGAPARLPRDLTPALGVAEVDWLSGGRRVEVAAIPPERLLAAIRHALTGAQDPPGYPASGAGDPSSAVASYPVPDITVASIL